MPQFSHNRASGQSFDTILPMAMVRKLTDAGLILLICLLSADGRTVYDIPSLKADLGFTPPRTTEFDLTVKVILPCSKQDQAFVATDGSNTLYLVNSQRWPRLTFAKNDILHVKGRIRDKGNPDCLSIQVVGKGPPEPIVDLTVGDFAKDQHEHRLVRV